MSSWERMNIYANELHVFKCLNVEPELPESKIDLSITCYVS